MSAGVDYTANSDSSVKVTNLSMELQTVATGTGVGKGPEDVKDVIGIRMGVLSDQDGILTTEHLSNAGVILRTSFQPIIANKGEFLSFHPRASTFRWNFDNTSASDATVTIETHFAYTAFTPTQSLVSATLARTSLATQTRAMLYDYKYDSHGVILPSSRDMLVAARTSLVADAFLGPLDTANWTTTVAGSGASSISSQKLLLATGATANSTVKFVSNQLGRFIAGNIQGVKLGIELPDVGTTNNKRRWGAYDDNNGYFFELDGTTLYAVGRKNGTDTRTAAGSWSSINTFVLTTNSVHSYEISYYADVAYFIIDDEVHHIMSNQGYKGSFPVRYENNNSGGSTTNVQLFGRGAILQRYGPDQTSPQGKNMVGAATTTWKIGSGRLHRIVVNNSNVNGTITVYDNTAASGTKLATITLTAAALAPVTVDYGVDFNTGLTIVTSAAATDITVVYD